MTPETEALIARAIQCHSAMTTTADSLTYAGANRELRRLAPRLATALEAAEKRADAAEAKLEALNREYKDAGKHISLQVARAESAEAKLKESSAFFEDAIGEQIIQAKMWKGHYAGDPEGQKDEAFWDGQERAFEMCLNLVKSTLTQLEP